MGKEKNISCVLNEYLPYAAWAVAFAGMIGSLFFSDVMDLPPCSLCWYQRIAMYPLVLILGIGIVSRDGRMKLYGLPFGVLGLAIAAYHNLLYYGFISEAITPCSEGVPCTAKQLELLGFVSIPLLSLAAFIIIALSLLFYKPKEK